VDEMKFTRAGDEDARFESDIWSPRSLGVRWNKKKPHFDASAFGD